MRFTYGNVTPISLTEKHSGRMTIKHRILQSKSIKSNKNCVVYLDDICGKSFISYRKCSANNAHSHNKYF